MGTDRDSLVRRLVLGSLYCATQGFCFSNKLIVKPLFCQTRSPSREDLEILGVVVMQYKVHLIHIYIIHISDSNIRGQTVSDTNTHS